jgi:hypothetical protein
MKTIANVVCATLAGLAIAGCASAPAATESTGSLASEAIVPIGDGGCPGVGTVICINGGTWDPQLCECVPPPDAACIQNVLCIRGDHFDRTLCKCVPDADAGACISQEDGPCGGFIQNACQCAAGLVCVPNRIPDLPGTCEPARCCPLGWDMYACTEENGSGGFNCHNPLLACPSSLSCGGGCDFQVQGQCPVCDPIRCPAGETFDRTLCQCVPL